jgi:hypothetical protein
MAKRVSALIGVVAIVVGILGTAFLDAQPTSNQTPSFKRIMIGKQTRVKSLPCYRRKAELKPYIDGLWCLWQGSALVPGEKNISMGYSYNYNYDYYYSSQ